MSALAAAPPRPAADRLRAALPVIALPALVAASAVLRTRAIGQGFWIDEGLAAGIASHPLGEIPGLLRQDGSPPLHYELLHAWAALAGDVDASTRIPSLAAALACIPAGLWAGRSLFGPRAGWACALLAATCPLLTVMAQEARMYSLAALLGLLAAACWAHAFAFRRRAFAAGFAAALALLLYTHTWGVHLAIGTLAGLALVVRAAPDRRPLLRDAALAYGAAALAFLPWLPTLLFQAAHTGAPWSDTPGPLKLLDPVWVPLGQAAGGAVALAAGGWGLGLLLRRGGPRERAAIGGLAVTVLAAGASGWLVAQAEPGWADRYLALFAGPVLLLAAAGLAALPRRVGVAASVAVVVLWAADLARPVDRARPPARPRVAADRGRAAGAAAARRGPHERRRPAGHEPEAARIRADRAWRP